MKKIAYACIVAAGVSPALATTASPFDGTWKQQADSAKLAGKPISFRVKAGVFTCLSCVVPFHVKADGTDQPVTGQVNYDSVSLQVVDARTIIEINKMKGKLEQKQTVTISPDGNKATDTWTRIENDTPTTGTVNMVRKSAAPAGAHALSGDWQPVSLSNVSDNTMVMTIKQSGGTLAFSTPTGLSYAAKLGGPAVTFHGEPSVQLVSIKSHGPREIVETDMRDGKTTATVTMTVAPDDRTMTIRYVSLLRARSATFTALKQ